MSKMTYNGRPIEIEGINGEDRDTLWIDIAYYSDSLEDIPEDELDEVVKQNYGEIFQEWIEHNICAAEYYYFD